MKQKRSKTLNVGFPNGQRIKAEIKTIAEDNYVKITTDKCFKQFKKLPDNEKNYVLNKDGSISIECKFDNYAKVLDELTKYIEDTIFKAMLEQEKKEKGKKDEGKNSSNKFGFGRKGNTGSDPEGETGTDKEN